MSNDAGNQFTGNWVIFGIRYGFTANVTPSVKFSCRVATLTWKTSNETEGATEVENVAEQHFKGTIGPNTIHITASPAQITITGDLDEPIPSEVAVTGTWS